MQNGIFNNTVYYVIISGEALMCSHNVEVGKGDLFVWFTSWVACELFLLVKVTKVIKKCSELKSIILASEL